MLTVDIQWSAPLEPTPTEALLTPEEFARVLGATIVHDATPVAVCSFSLGARGYCMGDEQDPSTHDSQCPRGER